MKRPTPPDRPQGPAVREPGRLRRFLRSRRLPLLDVGLFCASYAVTMFLNYLRADDPGVPVYRRWPNFLILLLFGMGGRFLVRIYRHLWQYSNIKNDLLLLLTDAASGVLALFTTYGLKNGVAEKTREGVWREICRNAHTDFWQTFSVMGLFAVFSLMARLAYQLYREHRSANKPSSEENGNKIGVAIVGAGQLGNLLVKELRINPNSRYRPVCFTDKNASKIGQYLNGLPVYEECDAVIEKLRKLPVQEIIVAIAATDRKELQQIILRYSDAGFRIRRYGHLTQETLDRAWTGASPRRHVVRDFHIEDLLGRATLEDRISSPQVVSYYRDKVVLVTGGGGSIGSEICRQIAGCRPKQLIILDINENNAYAIQQELLGRREGAPTDLRVEIASVRDRPRLECLFAAYRPHIVFHAAAHKHVPLMEHSPCEAIKNNVMGTRNVADMAEKYGAEKFMLISTDKAVNPTNIMGASKRVCEMVVQCRADSQTSFSAVRFGNVLNSSGSVIPLFLSQIEQGGPVTVTDRRIERFFMSIPEASQLVVTAAAMAKSGELFVLDMGRQVKIWDLAESMIRLSGYIPHKDIEIKEIGLRPGEKIYEELLTDPSKQRKTENQMIFIETAETPLTRGEVDEKLRVLQEAVDAAAAEPASPLIREALKRVVPTFREPDEVNRQAEDRIGHTRSLPYADPHAG